MRSGVPTYPICPTNIASSNNKRTTTWKPLNLSSSFYVCAVTSYINIVSKSAKNSHLDALRDIVRRLDLEITIPEDITTTKVTVQVKSVISSTSSDGEEITFNWELQGPGAAHLVCRSFTHPVIGDSKMKMTKKWRTKVIYS